MATLTTQRGPDRSSTPTPARTTVRQRLSRLDVAVSPYLYITPFFLVFLLVGLVPLAYTVWVSLHRWTLGGPDPEFLGLDNYVRLLGDEVFWNAVGNTVAIFVISSSTQIAAALWIAVLLDSRIRARTTFRMGVLLPYVTSLVAVGVIFSNLFSDENGLVNAVIEGLGLDPVSWHRDQLPGWIAVATMVNWRWTGYNALIFLAAMQAIPRDLYESATIDGAGAWNRFRHVTLPMVRGTVIFVVITSSIGAMQLFTEPMLFTPGPGGNNGGPSRQYQTVVMLMFQESFSNMKLGYGATIAVALLVIILVIALMNFLLSRLIASDSVAPSRRRLRRRAEGGATR
ncbi:carbohydrate ABC transporter permease [Jiangella anatolica]|uniref:ABC transporter permease n=1 Tax=Jiangella anatolica TaxID=2670374 RepID=A0A2W2BB59_9ACTN|nr:sugar ABC transporter permease [Jiangella anatolica]PZF84811.1 ABC transporter permease [Jiangella anatolica]